ncbi:MAG: hypothetical protein ABR881_19770 [Candidatus Sulfotelmatobacter sp.]|jgi:hypothetical protein
MNRRFPLLCLVILALAILSACGSGYDSPPGTTTGTLTVQMAQAPPPAIAAGGTAGIVATVLYDKKNGGVSWSCTPVGTCGTFSPATTGYQIATLYTAPTSGPAGALNIPVTITATSVTDSTQTASATTTVQVATPALLQGQYAFVLEGYASFGMVGSITLDGNGNVVSGEGDASANGFYSTIPSITGTYTLDPTGHGTLALSLNNTGCCGTLAQTHAITCASTKAGVCSHLLISEADQFNGLTIGGVGSMDLQTAGPNFSAAQVSGGYSFTLIGFSAAAVKAAGGTGLNGSWGGIFTADGAATITDGIFDTNTSGGAPSYSSIPFTGTFTPPDANGRGTLTLSTNGGTSYAYYIVTPEVLRLTSMTNLGYAGNTGSAYGQGTVGTTNAALTGSYVFGDLGFDVPGNAMGAAGQFKANGNGGITAGIMDLNDSGNSGTLDLGLSWAASAYSISGSPRGTITGPSGQTYNVYLTDPGLNLLDPNNSSGGGGALLLETDSTFSAIGTLVPQPTPSSAALQGPYALLLSDQNSPANSDGGFVGDFVVSPGAGTFAGEGAFQGQGTNSATLIVGPVAGTFTADSNNPGRFTGTVTTTPAFPNGKLAGTTPGTEMVSYYLASGSQGFVVETDTAAPVTGLVEVQDPLNVEGTAAKRFDVPQSRPTERGSAQHGHPSKPR